VGNIRNYLINKIEYLEKLVVIIIMLRQKMN